MAKKFNVHDYVEYKYAHLLEEYQENYGHNGMDLLWECESEAEVDELMGEADC